MEASASSIGTQDDFTNPFLGLPSSSPLDPSSSNFSARAWLSNLVGFLSKHSDKPPSRRTGVTFRNLSVYGYGSPTDYQKNVANVLLSAGSLFRWLAGSNKQKIQILRDFDGVVEPGELLLVLGRPGSGCSSLLKTISGDTYGFFTSEESEINYQGISAAQMHSQFRGEAIYMAENDVHFPQLTVGDTLLFAAKARAPRDDAIPGVSRELYARHMRDVIMATFGLTHTINTNVGSALVPGVSGGERKRVSIAEAALSGSPLQCWDNSTRGLDSANALEFCKTLRLSADMVGTSALVSLYQGSQDAYNLFDKVTVLYEGRQIYFGRCDQARVYFTNLGFDCAPRQTTADFLTSLTSPAERIVKTGFEGRTPRTTEDFVRAWRSSSEYASLHNDIGKSLQMYPSGGASASEFEASRRAQQSAQQRITSPYTLSLYQQVMICVERGFLRLKGDASVTISRVVANIIMALIVGSIFYNLKATTDSFYGRGALLFFAVLLNAFASALEILILYEQRPIVEKHARYALYHPFAEAISSALCDMPYKIINCITFNLILYFLTNLRRTPSAFFTFLVFSFCITMTLSMVFRTLGAASKTLAQALCPSAIFTLALMIYTGFVIPIRDMHPWFRWIGYINPLAYVFESLMVNEFDGRSFTCSTFVPSGPEYDGLGGENHICSTVGAVPGSNVVSGTEYLRLTYNYERAHMWRNLGIIIAMTVFFTVTYLLASEYVSAKKSKGEVLSFQRGHRTLSSSASSTTDTENNSGSGSSKSDADTIGEVPQKIDGTLRKQTSIFQWRDICYDIKIKKEERRILDRVDGWVKPGTLTALMGPSGAGKTTLLDVLATRDTIGVASGEALVDGRVRDISFQRKTGYAQQQDIHLETMTVREALRFQALMAQSGASSRTEKLAYVEEVIHLLGMETYADAIVGVPGEGLNVEQRKKLTIAVELSSRPELLLFLDEPSSGLDSQTSWTVLDLLEKLTAHGQAILCTIHQPSAMLFQRFDRLLFLAPEGKPVYFGEIGSDSTAVVSYFERNGAEPCPPDANPAEWIMEVIGCTPGSKSEFDWPEIWRQSSEYAQVHKELDEMEQRLRGDENVQDIQNDYKEFAASFSVQLWECFIRVNKQYWRTPSYIYSKIALSVLTALFLGFSFYKAENTIQGLQNQTFSIFMLLTLGSNFVPQILPNIVLQRSIYEARERPAKTYSWLVFVLSNILVEIPWNTLMAVLIYIAWYYPIGWYRNAEYTDSVGERGGVMFLFVWMYMLYASTFANMIQAGVELAEMAGNFANLLFTMSLIFSGILVSPDALPRFWIFMYRLSPFTYLISSLLSTALSDAPAHCSSIELLRFSPPSANTSSSSSALLTCGQYLQTYITNSGGYLTNPASTTNCEFCPISDTNSFLRILKSEKGDVWRNFGILWVYVLFNVLAAVGIYWLARVPKGDKGKKTAEGSESRTGKEKERVLEMGAVNGDVKATEEARDGENVTEHSMTVEIAGADAHPGGATTGDEPLRIEEMKEHK